MENLVQASMISRLDYGNALLFTNYPSISDRPPTASADHTLRDPVSHIQNTEWNSTVVSKRSDDPNVHTSENAPF